MAADTEAKFIGVGGNPLADMLSITRACLLALVAILSYQDHWVAAFVIFAAAWFTDLLDGTAARRYGSLRDNNPNLDMDGICDSVLAFGSSLVVVIYGWRHYEPIVAHGLVAAYIITIIAGICMVMIMNLPQKNLGAIAIIAINMIVIHGIIQIFGTAAWFAYMAFGASGVVATVIVAIPVAWSQRHKMRLWMQGRFA